jgi:hypothetical protein
MSARTLSAVRALAVFALLTLGLHSAAHAQATCTGLCTQQVVCPGNGTTSISGTVYAPNGTDPLPNVLVYIPNAPVTAFPTNVQCNPNGTPASGSPLVSTTTAVNGTFTLTNVPMGSNIPLVIQAGKWRRQFVIPTVSSCVNTPASNATGTGMDSTSVPTGHNIHLPQNQGEGDIPKIAIATGKVDAVECVLSKMGVATSEFTNPGGSGRINFYLGLDGPGAQIAGGGTPSETQLEDNLSTLAQYDLVMLPCQGAPYTPDSTALSYMAQYANVGGRIYATHYSYDFLTYPSTTDPTSSITSPFQGVANWDVEQTTTISTDTATINTSFPDGSLLANWLQVVGASTTLGQIPVNTIRQDQDGIVAPTQSYLSISNPPESIQFTFSTPVGVPPANQCGRVLYNEYHVENSANTSSYTFPAECASGAITAQERFLEYSLFDLGTFSTPPATPTVSVSVTASPNPVTQGDTADTATINITNTGTTATNTTLSLALTLPAGLTATALTPASPTSGWTCNVTTLTCTRGTGLDAGSPDNVDNVLLTFSVSNTATSPQAITATVSNGNLATPFPSSTLSLPVLEVPTIAWGPLAPITYGTPLGSTQLNAVASYAGVTVQGTYVYTPPAGTYLTPATGPQTLSVTFTPDGSGTYAPTTQIVGLQVNPGTPSITVSAPSSITYGTPSLSLSALLSGSGPVAPTGAFTFLIDGSISVPATCTSSGNCTATYNSAATLTGGAHTLTASIAADTNYTAATSSSVQFFVNQATPTVNTSPFTITYGTVPVIISTSVNYSGPAAPTGTVSTNVDGSAPVSATCHPAGAGTLNCTTDITNVVTNNFGAYLTAGIHTIISSISGDTNYTNYNAVVRVFTVNPAPLTISIIGNPTKPYDTTTTASLTSANYQVGGTIGTDAITVNQPSGTYAAATVGPETVTAFLTSSSLSATHGSLSNYTAPASASGPGTITQAQTTNTITWTTPPAINYGTLLTSAQLDATSTVAGSFNYTPGLAALLNAGPQTLNATFTPNDTLDYASGSASVVLTVNPVAPTINFSVPGVHTYGDSSFNLSATSNSGAPITFSYVSGPASVSGNTVTITGAGLVTVSASQIAAGNYTSGSQNATFNVLPKPLTITIIGNPTKPYDTTTAASLTPSNYQVGGTVGTDSITVNQPVGAYAAATVGPETVTAFLTSSSLSATHGSLSNYTAPASASGSGTITQATTSNTITWATPPAINYGTPLTSAQLNATSSLGSLGNFSYNPALGALLNAGPQTLNATFTPIDTVDYAVGTASVVLTVNPIAPTINFSVPGVHTYGDPSITLSATSNSGAPITFSYVSGPATVSGNTVTITGAGLVTVSASQVAAGNYTSGSQTATFSVAPKPLTVTAGSYSGTYDGTKHALSACVVSNNPDNLTCTNSPAGPVGPDATSGAVVVTPVLSGSTSNYSVTSNNGSYSIGPLTVTVTAGGYSGNYDANTHATLACVSTYAGVTCANSPASVGPGVGSGTVTPVASVLTGVASDYTIAPQNSAWSIIPAPSNLSLSCPTSVAYNGAAQTPCTAAVTGGGGLSQSVTVGYFSNTNIGTATATATFANSNYLTSTKMVNFAITPALLTVTAGSYSGTYDGNAHALSACVVSPNPDHLTCTNSPAGPVGPDVTTGAVVVGPVLSGSASNYSVTSNNGSYAISPLAVTVTAGSYSGVYNGSAHAPSACTSSYAGVPCVNSPASVGPGVGSGTVNPVPSYPTGNAADYTVTKATGTYSITKINPVITWANPAAITYGTPLSNTQLNATANVPGTFFYTAPVVGINPAGTLLPAGVSPLGAGFTPTDTTDYNSVSAYVQITVNTATTTTTLAVTTTQTVTGTTATITATVHPQIGGTPTGTITYYSGSTNLGSAAVGTPFTTGVLPVGADPLTAVYSGDSNFIGSSSSATTVTSIAPTNIILTPALSHVFYPASSVAYTVIVPLKLLQIVSGTITVYDGTTVIGTFNVLPTGVVVGVTPQLSVGTHNLRAVYSGNSQYPPGQSPIETVTVTAL